MNRVALISGGAHGIGAGIAARLIDDGWRVVIADRDVASGRQTATRLGSTCRFEAADVSNETDVERLLHSIQTQETQLDGLVCNAGFMIRKKLHETTLAEWDAVIRTNLTSIFLLARASERLLRQAKGAIVTVASTRAHQSEANTESYSASKGGVVALTHALAVSLGPDIRVNCISPGWVDVGRDPLRPEDHAQHPVGRVGTVTDIAALAAWLLGSESGFVTGSEIISDGGMTRRMIYVE